MFVVLKVKKSCCCCRHSSQTSLSSKPNFICLTVFLSRIFINKVLPITKAVANYDDYLVMFCEAKSKLYRLSLGPKSNNMFIRITAAIDSWFCFQIWFCQVLVKWHCNSLLLLSRLTRVTKKLQKPSLWIWNWISHRDCRKVSWPWLVNRVAWATGLVNCWKQFHFLIESTMENWIRKRVLSCCLKSTSPRISWQPATEFRLICLVNKSFILVWVYHLSQNEWLFW